MTFSSPAFPPLGTSLRSRQQTEPLTFHGCIVQILIANNGLGAIKAINSIRRWSYQVFGSEQAFQFLVMATPADIGVGAEYVKMADEVCAASHSPLFFHR